MATAGGCATQSPSPIDNNMGRLESEMNELHLRLDTLKERLALVMDSPPITEEGCGQEKTEKGGSGLATRLLNAKESLSKEIDIINDILQRLEI